MDARHVQALVRNASQSVVIDQDNALIWQGVPTNARLKLNRQDSIARCEAFAYVGYDNWRFSNINGLLSVLPY